MQIVYIHGFNSSARSFNYIHGLLPDHEWSAINYKSHQHIEQSMADIVRQLPKGKFSLVGHSLGGILAVLVAAEHIDRVERVASISAPFGGSRAALALRWLPGHPKVMADITPTSAKIELLSQLKLQVPTLSIVSTGGSLPTAPEPNDSIVTVASQKALKFGKKVEIKANHFEILMHEKTVKHLQDFLFQEETDEKPAA